MEKLKRIEEETVERQVDLRALLRSRGIALKKFGYRKLAADCPFHTGADGSFIVDPATGTFKCNGCGVSGGAIDFLVAFDGISRRHAAELLRDGGAAFRRAPRSRRIESTVRRLECPLDADARDAELIAQTVDYCHERLLSSSAALEWLGRHGLRDEEALRQFQIGFADRSLGLRIPENNRREGGILRGRLKRLGLLRPSGHEHFGGALMLPVAASDSGVCGIYGRRIGTGLRRDAPRDLWLPPLTPPIWNRDALAGREAIVCLRPLDALTLWINGLRNCSFIYGGDVENAEHLLDALLADGVESIRLAFPNDRVSLEAAKRWIVPVFRMGFELFQTRFPFGMGAFEYAAEIVDPSQALHDLIAAAEWKGASRARIAVSNSPNPIRREYAESEGDFLFLELHEREYRAAECGCVNDAARMKIALRLRRGSRFHIDRIDLYSDRDRRRFAARAAQETGLDKELLYSDLGTLLLALEERRHVLPEQDIPGKPEPEMAEQTRWILEAARTLASESIAAGKDGSFTRRDLRVRLGCGLTRTRTHIERLRDLGLVSRRQSRPGGAFRYRIVEIGGAE